MVHYDIFVWCGTVPVYNSYVVEEPDWSTNKVPYSLKWQLDADPLPGFLIFPITLRLGMMKTTAYSYLNLATFFHATFLTG